MNKKSTFIFKEFKSITLKKLKTINLSFAKLNIKLFITLLKCYFALKIFKTRKI